MSPPGFHGKSPARGDFLTRRIPSASLALWDAWLAQHVATTRAALGPGWLGRWQVAPIWHFTLGAGLLSPAQWQGVWIPSVDRVGRYFPFTILGPASPEGQPAQAWAAAAEPLALSALEDDFSPDALDAALGRLGPPCLSATAPDGHSLWRHSEIETEISFAGLPGKEAVLF